jgi:hypothetical protein
MKLGSVVALAEAEKFCLSERAMRAKRASTLSHKTNSVHNRHLKCRFVQPMSADWAGPSQSGQVEFSDALM